MLPGIIIIVKCQRFTFQRQLRADSSVIRIEFEKRLRGGVEEQSKNYTTLALPTTPTSYSQATRSQHPPAKQFYGYDSHLVSRLMDLKNT